MRTARRIAIRTMAAVVLLAGGLLFFLATGPGEDILRGLAERRVGAALDATVSIGGLETNLFSRVELTGVAIDPASDASSVPSIRVERLRARYGIFALLFNGPGLDTLIVEGARIAVRADSIPRVPAPADTAAAIPFDAIGRFVPPARIARLQLSDVSFVYDDRSVPVRVEASGIGVTMEMDGQLSGVYRIGVEAISVDYFDSPVGLLHLRLLGSVNGRSAGEDVVPLTVDSLGLDAAGMRVDGRMDLRADSLSGVLALSGDPARLARAVSDGLEKELGPGPVDVSVAFAVLDPLGEPALRWSAGIPAYAVAGVPVSNVRFDGGLRGDTLAVDRLSMGVYGGEISGRGRMVVDSLLTHGFTLRVAGVAVSEYWKPAEKGERWMRVPVALDAEVESRGPLSVPLDIEATATVDLSAGRSPVAGMAMEYRRRHLSVRPGNGLVSLSAEADVGGTEAAGNVDVRIESIGGLASLAGFPLTGGSVALTADVKAPLSPPSPRGAGSTRSQREASSTTGISVTARATGREISYEGIRLADTLFALANFAEGGLRFDTGVVSGGSIDAGELAIALGLTAPGPAAADTPHGPATASAPHGPATASAPAVGGTLSYRFSLSGPVDDPRAEVRATIRRPSVGGAVFDSLEVEAALSDSMVTLARAALSKDASVTAAAGEVDLHDLHGIVGGATVEFRNGASPSGGFSGDGSTPDTVRARFSYRDTADYSLSASSRHLAVPTLRAFAPSLPAAGGQLDFDLDVRRQGDRLAAEVPFAFTGLSVRDGVIDSIRGTLRYDDGTVAIDSVSVSNDGHRFRASAALTLGTGPGGTRFFDWDCRTRGMVEGDSLDLSRLVPFLHEPPGLAGIVGLDIRWDGIVRRPNFAGTIGLSGVRYGPAPASPWFTDLSGTVRMGAGAAHSDSLVAMAGKVPLTIDLALQRGDSLNFSAAVDVSTDSTLLLNVRASFAGDSVDVEAGTRDLDIAVAQPFVAGLRKLGGRLTTSLTVRGSTADPRVDGSLEVRGLTFEPGSTGFPLTGGVVRARLSSGRIWIDTVAGGFGGGTLFASGGARIDSGRAEDLDLRFLASDIRLSKKALYEVNVKSADLALRSAGERYPLTGTVEFGESKFVRDIELADIARMMASETGDPLEEKKPAEPLDLLAPVKEPSVQEDLPGFARRIDFDVELKNAAGFWVDNNLARFTASHDLRLTGTLAEANVTGRVTVRDRGLLTFLDRKFEILNGVIDFSDPRRVNPVINLTAQTEITETPGGSQRPTRYVITLTVSGPLDEFDYALTSKPALEQADIISLIALGMTQYSLEAGGGKDAVYRDRSEVIASQQISSSVNRFFDNWLGDILALDHIGIGGNLFDPDQARFEVTKRWSDRVEIRYSASIKNVDEQILSAEYRITDFLFLEGKTDQKEDSGADLKFRIWFR